MNLPFEQASDLLNFAQEKTDGWKMFIGGKWVDSTSGKRFVSYDPSTNQPLAEVPEGNAEDVSKAVEVAKDAFPSWNKLHIDERGVILRRFADKIRNWAETFGMLDALDSGNPYEAMVADAKKGAGLLDFFSGLGMEIKGQTIQTPGGGLNYTRMEAFGVVGRILPFNHPISFAAGKIAAPLVAGNTVVLKPAEQTPLSALLLGKLAEECLPPGVLNIVTGDGPNCGSALVRHPHVYRIAFTGGVETGRRIIQDAGIKTVSLELGGKNPLIIYPDADVKKVAAATVAGMNFSRSQGQSCGSNSRVFVHETQKGEFLKEVISLVKKIKCGMPTNPMIDMGPVISKEHYNRVMSYIESAKEEGAELIIGGRHPLNPELEDGNFIEPTVFSEVKHGMKIEQEEIFGPVMSVLSWNDEEKMLYEVNDVEYGLCANIWTNDVSRALRVSERVEAGYVWVNGHGGKRFKGAPFGGYKNSGIGREHSLDELISYTQIKNINIRYE
ncbi:aldehyde dehydrogenase family protein [Halalkalibacter okhensis]|uniref:Aldehyde dehydrogenase n=1 Tax=Halalkalibacter okhensis TaxID=333138 RepID=A0A0B0IBD9_9BACI|nr:aldehyde dehydrogenase family protein [Halalkalibacter okhensis]KHF38620.1 aldehyde dehydrogenase [Halalkalibacter okhensis]